MTSSDLYFCLERSINFNEIAPLNWWPNYGSFWIVVESILGQNTKYENVKKATQNLQNANITSLSDIAKLEVSELARLIKPSGFYNTKAKRLSLLCKNILNKFGNFENFKENVSKEWLLSQNGLGFESVYSILCYACEREYMVVDKYTAVLLGFLGYEFDDYESTREWLENISEVQSKYPQISLAMLLARYHGLIVEFCKAHLRKNEFSQQAQEILKNLL